jgi:hypothetical protein
VTVFVDITEELVQRSIELDVKPENLPRGARVTPLRVALRVKGPMKLVNVLEPREYAAVVDAAPGADEAEAESYERSVRVQPELPERAQLVGGAPKVEIALAKRRKRRK